MFFSGSKAGSLIKTNLETTITSWAEEIRFKGCKFFFQKFAACAYAVPWLNTEECLLSVLILDDFFQFSFSFIHQRFTVSNGVARVCFFD